MREANFFLQNIDIRFYILIKNFLSLTPQMLSRLKTSINTLSIPLAVLAFSQVTAQTEEDVAQTMISTPQDTTRQNEVADFPLDTREAKEAIKNPPNLTLSFCQRSTQSSDRVYS